MLQERFGPTIRPRDLARFLGLSYRTTINRYKELGGQRIGKKIIFFEREVIRALEAKGWKMDRPGPGGGQENPESLPLEVRRPGLGISEKGRTIGPMEDRHGIFPWEAGE